MNGGADSDLSVEGFRKWSAGPSFGRFLKPASTFRRGRAGVYGLFGVTRMETTYQFQNTGLEYKDRIWSGAAGTGMQYNFASGLSASVDVLWTQGEARYPHLFNAGTGTETVTTATASIGLNYRF